MQPTSRETLLPPNDASTAETLTDSILDIGGRQTLIPSTPGTSGSQSAATGARFQVVGALGRGGIGEVFAADDRDIGRRVAIKRVREDRRSESATVRFVQEVRTTGQLDHPNIVPIHDVGRQEDGSFFFVMKYLDGESLHGLIDRLRSGDTEAHAEWTFERRVDVFRKVLEAVRFAHRQGVIHRDIKPENIMIGRFGEVHVVDWGLAKRIGTPEVPGRDAVPEDGFTSQHGSLVGTPLYMAPEQARKEPADERTDIWQLCMLLYELLTLNHPLDDLRKAPLEEILDAVQNRRVPRAVEQRHPSQSIVPVDLCHIMHKGLQRDPARRFQTVDELMDRLQRRIEGHIPVECPVTFEKRVLQELIHLVDRAPRASMLLLMAGVTLLGVAALGGLWGLVRTLPLG
ncbi:MAG: serine/threonine protein kinase [Myxococcales bacterium]|nr:serine/threonine protein kinase [Myxococcales bacterium]